MSAKLRDARAVAHAAWKAADERGSIGVPDCVGGGVDCPRHTWVCDQMTAAILADREAVREACAAVAHGTAHQLPSGMTSACSHGECLSARAAAQRIRALDLTWAPGGES